MRFTAATVHASPARPRRRPSVRDHPDIARRLPPFLIAICATAGATATAAAALPAAASASVAQASCPTGADGSTRNVSGAPLRTILRVPTVNRTRRAPLVLALHFASGAGHLMEIQTHLTAQARQSGFDVAYPTATSNGVWQPADLPKLRRTITAIEKAACIDHSRVYLLGWSNGGGMAALGACRMAGTIAAVALFAPATGFVGPCSPSRAPSVLEVHGTADPLVSYAGGRAFIGAWARRDGCDATPTTSRIGMRGTRLRWHRCDDGASVEHIRVAGAGHTQLFADLRADRIQPGPTAWRFLSAHRLG